VVASAAGHRSLRGSAPGLASQSRSQPCQPTAHGSSSSQAMHQRYYNTDCSWGLSCWVLTYTPPLLECCASREPGCDRTLPPEAESGPTAESSAAQGIACSVGRRAEVQQESSRGCKCRWIRGAHGKSALKICVVPNGQEYNPLVTLQLPHLNENIGVCGWCPTRSSHSPAHANGAAQARSNNCTAAEAGRYRRARMSTCGDPHSLNATTAARPSYLERYNWSHDEQFGALIHGYRMLQIDEW
jgi:hypothetical protein